MYVHVLEREGGREREREERERERRERRVYRRNIHVIWLNIHRQLHNNIRYGLHSYTLTLGAAPGFV